MSFQVTAKSIVEDSIKSAIYIDDRLIVPFEKIGRNQDATISSALYRSFRNNQVGLEFYKYRNGVDWTRDSKLIFKGNDLIILDWELDNDDVELNTLRILKQAIETPSLHFVCIYTNTPEARFDDIMHSINAYFSTHDLVNASAIFNSFREEVQDEGLLQDDFIETLKGRFKDLVFYEHRRSAIFQELKDELTNHLGDHYKAFQTKIRAISQNPIEAFEAIGYALHNRSSHPDRIAHEIKIDYVKKFLKISNTIVYLSNKATQKPDRLFTIFRDAVVSSSGNFLTFMGLEIRNFFKESYGFIGKEIDSIDEAAFFFHKRQLHPPESFYDFLIDIWRSQAAAFLYEKKLKIFDELTLDAYQNKKKGLKKRIKKYSKDGSSDVELAKLNNYYNKIHFKRDLNDFVRFGDIFSILNDNATSSGDYLICITAHCDCLYPDNINNSYHFVLGKKIPLAEGLDKGDTDFLSFFEDLKKELICVRWNKRPISIHLDDNRILNRQFISRLRNADKNLRYVATVKENYTQRIANEAFSWPIRVGVDFANKKKK